MLGARVVLYSRRSHVGRAGRGSIMGARRVVTFALAALAALAATGALAADATFTAALGWVPIGGAERSDVAGEGKVTATLSGSKLSITGTFDGLPAKATAAKLHLGVAKG